jgi:hypothetical protein
MPFCQLEIQIRQHLREVRIDGEDRDSQMQVGSHHLDVPYIAEDRAQPLQLVAQMLRL